MLKKDKEKVLDEVWTEARVKDFLDLSIPTNVNADFYVLSAAYKNMRLENFEQFLGFFTDAERNINACDEKGRNLLSIVQQHRKGGDYAKALQAAGAK